MAVDLSIIGGFQIDSSAAAPGDGRQQDTNSALLKFIQIFQWTC